MGRRVQTSVASALKARRTPAGAQIARAVYGGLRR